VNDYECDGMFYWYNLWMIMGIWTLLSIPFKHQDDQFPRHPRVLKVIYRVYMGKSTLKWATLGRKWWCMTNMTMYNELFLGDNLLAILTSNKELLECAWQLFVIKVHFK
jgi:hypothetical protein